jgi:hypothetical protein
MALNNADMALNNADMAAEEYLSYSIDFKDVEDYLSNDSLDYFGFTYRIIRTYYEKLPINEFLDIVFKYNKTKLFLKQYICFAHACYIDARRVSQEIFDGFFIDAPIHIKNMYNSRINNFNNMIEINRYIGDTFRKDPRLGILNDLEYYSRKLDIMTKEYRKTLNKDYLMK